MLEKINNLKLTEADAMVERYARRSCIDPDRYSLTNPSVYMAYQERQRAILNFFANYFPVSRLISLKLMEVGCGNGKNLLDFLRFGLMTQNLGGIELLPERVAAARKILPAELTIHEGDANIADIAANSQDIVFQSVVFSSILDANFQQELARRMWQWVRPGGGVLWYDFIYNNPSNPDVIGIPLKRVQALFPESEIKVWRVTLAPPISRCVSSIHPSLYTVLNFFPFLRTHVLCWIKKQGESEYFNV